MLVRPGLCVANPHTIPLLSDSQDEGAIERIATVNKSECRGQLLMDESKGVRPESSS
jgi:hypothetical protein